MKIIVESDYLSQIGDAVRALPVKADGDFQTADRWVGIVLAIEKLIQESELYDQDEDETEEEE